jgi:UDP-N-acetylglucosamine--dolichyl-phosphate N-acetylglucosaminephosphotransferase
MIWIFLVFIISFLVTLFLTPVLIKRLASAGIIGTDIHKQNKTRIPEMGGLAILFGFSSAIFFSILFFTNGLVYLLAAFLTVLITGLIGICDDIFGIRHRIKAILPIFASIPLIVIQAGVHTMYIPFIGEINFGIIYPLILIPVGVTVAANTSNMLAGYNGLEAGLGFITCTFLGIVGLLINRVEISILMFALGGACLGFLKYNRYPSKIFPGDIGTFTIGAAIASAVIIGNIETIGLIAFAPYIINGFITVVELARGKPIQKFSTIEDNILIPPPKKNLYTLYFLIERLFKVTEKKLVWIIWVLGAIFGIISIGFLYI